MKMKTGNTTKINTKYWLKTNNSILIKGFVHPPTNENTYSSSWCSKPV